MLVSAVTLHNIPEGMSVGLLFAMAPQASVLLPRRPTLAWHLRSRAGYGLTRTFQRGRRGFRCLRECGMSRTSVCHGQPFSIVEPIFGIAVVLVSGWITPFMSWMLAFAAGAMIYVVVEELIPRRTWESINVGTLGVIAGFVLMMVLDVA